MAQLVCQVSEGLRASEATVMVKDASGDEHYLPIDREFLEQKGDAYHLPVTVVYIDEKKKAAFVELPLEADSGTSRIWVKLANLHDYSESLT